MCEGTVAVFERLGFTSGRSVRARLAALLVLGIAVHVAQFPFIESNSGDTTRALHAYETSDVLNEGLIPGGNAWSRYAYAVSLAEIAPGSTVYWASDVRREERRVYGFGQAVKVVILPQTSAELLGDFDPTPFIVSRGRGGERGAPWVIALAPGTGDYGDLDNPETFLDGILADGQRRVNDGGPPRVFLHVRWAVPPAAPNSVWDHHHMLIEASLLGLDEGDLAP